MARWVNKIVFTWLSLLTVTSILSLCRTFYSADNIGIDYSGILIGILSVLVTTLIGWQLYSFVGFSKQERNNEIKINRLLNILRNESENDKRGEYLHSDDLAEIYRLILKFGSEVDAEYAYIRHKLNGAYYCSRIGELEQCDNSLLSVITFIQYKHPEVKHSRKDNLLRILMRISSEDRIENHTKALEAVACLKVVET